MQTFWITLGIFRQLPHTQNLGNNRDKEVVLSGSIFESAVTTNVTGVPELFDLTRPLKSFQFARLPICALSEFLLVRTEHRNFSHAALELI